MAKRDAIDDLVVSGEQATPSQGEGPPMPRPWRVPVELLLLAGPVIGSMISRTAMSFVDFAMVSQLGTQAQAAIMPAGILLFCVISFGMGMLSVVNSFVAQSLGRGQRRDCAVYAWQALHLSLALGVIVLPAWFVMPGLFDWVGHAPAVRQMEIAYVRIGLLGMAPTLAAVALSDMFNGLHKPMVGFWAALVSNLFNALANYVLIFGHWAMPAMGIAGAAWGTAAAATLQTLLLLAWMLRPAMNRDYQTRHTWRPSWPHMKRIIRFGTPAGAQFTVDVLGFTVFTLLLVGRFGTKQLAAHNLVFKFLEISFMPTVGLGIAVTAAVGKAIGQAQPDLARTIVRWATGFAMTYMGLIGLSYVLFNHVLAGLLSHDPAVIGWASRLLWLAAVFQLFDAIGIIHNNALRGAGDNYFPAAAAALCGATIMIGGGYAMVNWLPRLQAMGPWLAATAYIIVLSLAMFQRWRHGPWQRIDMLGHGGQVTAS